MIFFSILVLNFNILTCPSIQQGSLEWPQDLQQLTVFLLSAYVQERHSDLCWLDYGHSLHIELESRPSDSGPYNPAVEPKTEDSQSHIHISVIKEIPESTMKLADFINHITVKHKHFEITCIPPFSW